ncbi:MAG: NUDIX domain-containing protein [Sulfitobacter sp.]|nr:NUDIX domain-containing protein [Sulfitobacter sp.]
MALKVRTLFFYGTLRHRRLLEIVLGRASGDVRLSEDVLPDHAVHSVAEGPFPMIEAAEGFEAPGLRVEGLTDADIARLDFYEGGFDYDLLKKLLSSGHSAEVYVPRAGLWTPGGVWSLAEWEAHWGPLSCAAAEEVMGYFGKRSRTDVGRIFGRIRSRAQARVNAATSRHGAGTRQGEVVRHGQERVYSHFYALDEIRLQFERFDGSLSEPVERAIFVGSDAAILLPYDPRRDRVLLIEQFRVAPLVRGDAKAWMLEPIAGNVDPGESPQECAHREAKEEAGLTLDALETIAEVYASPGNATEFFYIYLGLADLPDEITGTHGLESEHEDIRSHLIAFDDLMALNDTFAFGNAPLVLAINWLARNRDRLRSEVTEATSAGK